MPGAPNWGNCKDCFYWRVHRWQSGKPRDVGNCVRYPKWVETLHVHGCGEFVWAPDKEAQRIYAEG